MQNKVALPPLTNPVNQWACVIACAEWYLHHRFSVEEPPTQAQILEKLGVHFPRWKDQPGACSHDEVMRLLRLLGLRFRDFIHIHDLVEIQRELSKPGPKLTLILTQKPTNHCMALLVANSDNRLILMNPSQPEAEYVQMPLGQLLTDFDADFLFVYLQA